MGDDSQENLIDPEKPKAATIAEVLDALADFDLTADDHKRYGQSPADSRRPAVEAWQEGRADAKRQNKGKGRAAQRNKGIDAYRAGDGKADYNAMRRLARQLKAAEEGRPFQSRAPRGQTSPDQKREQTRERQAAFRAAMTTEQKAAESRKRQERRQKAKDKIAAALKDGAIF